MRTKEEFGFMLDDFVSDIKETGAFKSRSDINNILAYYSQRLLAILMDLELFSVGEYDSQVSDAAFTDFERILADIEMDEDTEVYLDRLAGFNSHGLSMILAYCEMPHNEYHRLAESMSLAVQRSELIKETEGRAYTAGTVATI